MKKTASKNDFYPIKASIFQYALGKSEFQCYKKPVKNIFGPNKTLLFLIFKKKTRFQQKLKNLTWPSANGIFLSTSTKPNSPKFHFNLPYFQGAHCFDEVGQNKINLDSMLIS